MRVKTVKIYGEKYDLHPSTSKPVDAYFKGKLSDNPFGGKVIGYCTMEDGSIVEVYKHLNPLVIIIPVIVLLLIAGGVTSFLLLQPKDLNISGFPIKQGNDQNIVTYNGFMALTDNQLNVNFQNGSEPATVTVSGDGIETQTINVEPEQFLASIPATFTTDSGVVNATITITTPTSTQENNCVIEIPANNTPNSTEAGLNGYWEGEFIYGVE